MKLLRRGTLVLVASAPAVMTAACIAHPSAVDAEKAVGASLGLPDAVKFRTEGDPVDVPLAPADVLSGVTAIRRSVETSPELQASLARVRAAQAEADLAGRLPNPILSLVFRFPEGGGSPEIEAGLAADLLAILQRPRRSSAAANRLEAEAASAISTALDVIAEARGLYANVQALDELVPLLEARLGVFERLREVARARLELGEGTRHDVTTLESERLVLEVELSRRRQELRLARIALARRIGEPSGAASWRLDEWQVVPPVVADEGAWVSTALRTRPEVLAIQWEIRARGDDVSLAKWSAFEGSAVGVEAERQGDWSAGPSVSTPLPIFDTGSPKARRARAFEAEAKHRLTEAHRRIVEEVRTSYAALAESQANLARVVNELIPMQERRHAEIEEAYRVGHVDVTALLVAEQSLQATAVQRVELERDVSRALLDLQRAVGGPSAFDSMFLQGQGPATQAGDGPR
ncbi:TolC family protein [Myxococcota bacterium]|nr:TolC family protein [Myxococcota bacterium]